MLEWECGARGQESDGWKVVLVSAFGGTIFREEGCCMTGVGIARRKEPREIVVFMFGSLSLTKLWEGLNRINIARMVACEWCGTWVDGPVNRAIRDAIWAGAQERT